MKNIIQVGMPGSGKSTLGIVLAKKIHYGYIDSNGVLVAQQGKLLPELIEELGNEGFLELEARVKKKKHRKVSTEILRCFSIIHICGFSKYIA